MEKGPSAATSGVMHQGPIKQYSTPSDPVFIICAQLSPPPWMRTAGGSDLLCLTAQVVVVGHGDHQEEHSTEEEEYGSVG